MATTCIWQGCVLGGRPRFLHVVLHVSIVHAAAIDPSFLAPCRAGQGGKQSGKDASGKYAKSAGSRLRRHNEVRSGCWRRR